MTLIIIKWLFFTIRHDVVISCRISKKILILDTVFLYLELNADKKRAAALAPLMLPVFHAILMLAAGPKKS